MPATALNSTPSYCCATVRGIRPLRLWSVSRPAANRSISRLAPPFLRRGRCGAVRPSFVGFFESTCTRAMAAKSPCATFVAAGHDARAGRTVFVAPDASSVRADTRGARLLTSREDEAPRVPNVIGRLPACQDFGGRSGHSVVGATSWRPAAPGFRTGGGDARRLADRR
jgi:hypothetical protein